VEAKPGTYLIVLRCEADAGLWEHDWANTIAGVEGAEVPFSGFGSSDCTCTTHLFYFAAEPPREALRRALVVDPADPCETVLQRRPAGLYFLSWRDPASRTS
jgi:hypothetical protein